MTRLLSTARPRKAQPLGRASALSLVIGALGCGSPSMGSPFESQTETGTSNDAGSESDSGNSCPPNGCLDILPDDEGTIPCQEEGGTCVCMAPEHTPCDGNADLLQAIGLNCEGEEQIEVESWGSPQAFGTLTSLGNTSAFDPREGERYAIIGSGRVADILLDPNTDTELFDICSSDLGAFDPGADLPAPIKPIDVGGSGCADDSSLIGTGDCSNTIQEQFEASLGNGGLDGAHDYTELRFTTMVPEGTSSFSFDFAFMSFEYPDFWQSQYNDIFIGWLESEDWTGNVSFDEMGRPVSVNASFMDFLDADVLPGTDDAGNPKPPHPTCPEGTGCSSEELTNTCMDGHGSTRWLTTTASVSAGSEMTLVFAVMDLGDSSLDSYALVDNFQWGCEGGAPPVTHPID